MSSAIIEILKNEEFNVRLSAHYRRWMSWDGREWVVYERKMYAKRSTVITRTKNEQDAVNALVYEEALCQNK